MKLLLKLLLLLVIAVAGIYAAIPLWLPDILVRQLPPGWQLEELQTGYPGISGININRLRLKREFAGGTLSLEGAFRLSRADGKVAVLLTGPAQIRYQDKAGKLNDLLSSAVPGLKRTAEPFQMAVADLAAGSLLILQPDMRLPREFSGSIKLNMTSAQSSIKLQATDLQVGLRDYSDPGSMTAEGLITLDWVEKAPFTFTYDGLDLQADQLSVAAELSAHNGSFISTGSSTFEHGSIAQMATSAARIEVSWDELDLLKRAGKLSTRTLGLTTRIAAETWSGFDFDVTYALVGNADIDGSGVLQIDAGPDVPIEFAGNVQAQKWNITLPAITIKTAQLGSLLRVVHLKLPATVKLTDGTVELAGDVQVADEITARLSISGYEMGASMGASTARQADLALDVVVGNTISANGPVLIETATLAGGIDVTNIFADVDIESIDAFGLKNLSAEMFGGQLNVHSLQFSEQGIADTTLDLAHIKLDRILAVADVDGLEGTGDLDVSLPVGSDQAGIYIKKGIFQSNGPGRLAYAKGSLARGNVGLQALENFLYQDFSGTIDYQSDGAYQITVHLKGKNPDLYGGKAIVFNLNINGSLPAVFDALLLTGNFEKSILEQIRRQ